MALTRVAAFAIMDTMTTYAERTPMPRTHQPHPEFMTPAEVAALFNVDPKTVSRWAKQGKLPYIKTLGGHRRFPREAVEAKIRVQTL